MGTYRRKTRTAYGMGDTLLNLSPLPIVAQRAPAVTDQAEIGTIWVDQPNDDTYILTKVAAGSATWINAGGGTGVFNALTVTTTATIGTGLTVTTGNVTLGGLGLGVVQSSAVGLLSSTAGTDGQLIIGATGLAPAWATVASGDGSVVIAAGANTLDLRVSGAAASTFPCDGGLATPILGATTIAGGTNITTAGAGGTVTVNLDAAPTLAGLLTCNLGIDVSGATAVLTSATDVGQAIYLHADAGTNETIQLHADQGTAVTSLYLLSDAGGITLEATTLGSNDAININAGAGGVDIDGAMQVNIASSQNAADALVLSSSAGGIDITSAGAGGEDIDILASSSVNITSTEDTAAAIYLHANGGASETIYIHSDQGTGVSSINIDSDVGGITLDSGLASDDAINLAAAAGGVDIDGAMQVNIASSENTADALVLSSSAGGIDITSGGAAGEDIDITASSSVNIGSTENAAQSIYLHANGGVLETIQLHADQGTDPLSLYLLSDAGGITIAATAVAAQNAVNISAGAGGVNLTSAMGTDILSDEDANDSLTVTSSAGGIDLTAAGVDAGDNIDLLSARAVTVTTTGDIVDAIYLHTNAGTTEQIHLHCDQGTAVDSIDIASDDGGITIQAGLVSDDAVNISSAGGLDVDCDMQINITSAEDTNDSISVSSTNGGIDIAAAGTDAGDDVNVTSARAITATTTGDIAQAIYLHANAGTSETIDIHADQGTLDTSVNIHSDAGGVTLDGSATGNIKLTPGTVSGAGAALTLDSKVGVSTHTGLTTASTAQQTFTITNNEVSATSGIIVSVGNVGANDARMTMERVKPAGGSFTVDTQNNGGAALNGDVIISWIVLN